MRVKFNGKELDTDFKTSLEFFENISKNENDVWIINGFATKENIALNEDDELFFFLYRKEQDTLQNFMINLKMGAWQFVVYTI